MNEDNKNGQYGKEDDSNKYDKNTTMSYANAVNRGVVKVENKSCYIPTEISENGNEVVIFDKDMVQNFSIHWQLTLRGYFDGYRMAYNEIRYHLRKMWGKYGLVDVFMNEVGIYFFRFNNEEGLNTVVESGPWMVNNKPLLVHKWKPELILDKVEPEKVPLWVKLFNVPIEAWSVKGVSAIASRLGGPIIMDAMTAKTCKEGKGMT